MAYPTPVRTPRVSRDPSKLARSRLEASSGITTQYKLNNQTNPTRGYKVTNTQIQSRPSIDYNQIQRRTLPTPNYSQRQSREGLALQNIQPRKETSGFKTTFSTRLRQGLDIIEKPLRIISNSIANKQVYGTWDPNYNTSLNLTGRVDRPINAIPKQGGIGKSSKRSDNVFFGVR